MVVVVVVLCTQLKNHQTKLFKKRKVFQSTILASRVVLTIFSTEEKYVSHRNCVCWRSNSTASELTDRTKLGT